MNYRKYSYDEIFDEYLKLNVDEIDDYLNRKANEVNVLVPRIKIILNETAKTKSDDLLKKYEEQQKKLQEYRKVSNKNKVNRLFDEYLGVSISEVDDFLEKKALESNISIRRIKEVIHQTSKTKSEEIIKKYKIRQEELKDYHRVVTVINKTLETGKLSYLDNLDIKITDNDFLEILNKFALKNPKLISRINVIKEWLNDQTKKDYNDNKIYLKYLESSYKEQSITNLITLLFCKTEEESLSLLSSYCIPKANFEIYIKKFAGIFASRTEDIIYLKNLYSKYADKEYKIFISKQALKMNEIYLSELSIEEYCHTVGNLKMMDIRNVFENLKKANDPEYNIIMEEILNRDKTEFYKKINEIAKDIILDEEFDLLSYYQYTKLSMTDFVNIMKTCIEDECLKENAVKKMVFLRSHYDPRLFDLAQNNRTLKKDYELKTTTIINGRLIENHEKEKIMEFMKQNRMHNYYYVYNFLLQKYASGTLDLDDIQYKLEK